MARQAVAARGAVVRVFDCKTWCWCCARWGSSLLDVRCVRSFDPASRQLSEVSGAAGYNTNNEHSLMCQSVAGSHTSKQIRRRSNTCYPVVMALRGLPLPTTVLASSRLRSRISTRLPSNIHVITAALSYCAPVPPPNPSHCTSSTKLLGNKPPTLCPTLHPSHHPSCDVCVIATTSPCANRISSADCGA